MANRALEGVRGLEPQLQPQAQLEWHPQRNKRGSGVPAGMKVYAAGTTSWEVLGCEEECACSCIATEGCVSFDFRSQDNRRCRMYSERSRASGGAERNVSCLRHFVLYI